MPDRWRELLGKLSEEEPDRDRVTPHPGERRIAGGEPTGSSRVLAAAVATVLAVASFVFVRSAFDDAPAGVGPAATSSSAPASIDWPPVTVDSTVQEQIAFLDFYLEGMRESPPEFYFSSQLARDIYERRISWLEARIGELCDSLDASVAGSVPACSGS